MAWRFGFALFLVIELTNAAFAQSSKLASQSKSTLRVGLWTLWHDKEIAVSPAPEGHATLRPCEGCSPVALTAPMEIRAAAGRLALPGNRQEEAVTLAGSVMLAAHGESIVLRNPVRISARNGELILSVTLPVESYVERVVASESGPADTTESLKALAIVVRSFALHHAHGHADYDLCDSTHCQLLHWSQTSEGKSAAHAATLSTAGETLWFHGQRAEAWFHQNCGGRTASPSEGWPAKVRGSEGPRKAMPWLVSRVDPYCTAGGAREWSTSVSLAELTAALAADGLVRAGWSTLTVARRGESGRAETLSIGAAEVSGEDFRLAVGRAMGWGRILSTWFEVSRQGDNFLFHGLGSGHGVGLCQAGAAAMSTLGRDSGQILAQYFPGAAVADEATGQAWQTFAGRGFALQTLAAADSSYVPQLSQGFAEAEGRSGLRPAGIIAVRAFGSTSAFRDATLAPGWVAAFTEGDWIATQPLSTLAARKMLVPVLRHEFLHALVEGHAKAGTPLWLREGLVEAWSDANGASGRGAPILKPDEIDHALAGAASEAQSEKAHQAAAWYAQRMLDHYGRAQVLAWFHSGLPPTALAGAR